MQISVVIPVYNAEKYVTQAVESALAQPETAEVLVIEDGSPDNSLEICQALAEKYEKVKLLRHPNGENRGAGASRNLGMLHAACDYVAFLDADDYFLPGRFNIAKQVFVDNPGCEGVYEAIGMHVEDEDAWLRWKKSGKPLEKLKTIRENVNPEDLGKVLVIGGKGHFSLNGFTIKKKILNKTGFMEETLKLHQDTNFIIRAALVSKLLPGRLDKPVTMWRVHQHNRVSSPRSKQQIKRERMNFLMKTYTWCRDQSHEEIKNLLTNMMFKDVISIHDEFLDLSLIRRFWKRFTQLIKWVFTNPSMILEPQLWKEFSRFVISRGRVI